MCTCAWTDMIIQRSTVPMTASLRHVQTVANSVRPVTLASTIVEAATVRPGLLPIVKLHGVLGSTGTYGSILRRKSFAPGRTKIGLDLRNHGRSPHVSGMDYFSQAQDVASTLRDLDVDRAILIGHSMGGKVAMHLALTQPELVAALVVVDIAPVRYASSKSPVHAQTAMLAMRAVDLAACKRRQDVDEALERNGVSSIIVRRFVMTNLLQGKQGAFRWRLNLDGIIEGLQDILGFPEQDGRVYQGRTCVIRGGKSQYVPFSAMRKYTTLFPNTKLVTLSDAGHWIQAEQPDAYCEAVNAFLEHED